MHDVIVEITNSLVFSSKKVLINVFDSKTRTTAQFSAHLGERRWQLQVHEESSRIRLSKDDFIHRKSLQIT
jgi:hypothetical protein